MALLKGTSMGFFRNPWAIVLLIVLVILLFGANKLPGLARNMGKSMRIFKSEVEELRGEDRGSEDGEDEDERPARSDRPREERRDDREYDPRDDQERDRVPIRPRDEDDSYRRDSANARKSRRPARVRPGNQPGPERCEEADPWRAVRRGAGRHTGEPRRSHPGTRT